MSLIIANKKTHWQPKSPNKQDTHEMFFFYDNLIVTMEEWRFVPYKGDQAMLLSYKTFDNIDEMKYC